MLDWEWYTDVNTTHLFVYCILKANHKLKKWRGITINRGAFCTSLDTISKETGLSVMQVRTAINKLESTNDITSKPSNKNRLITVTNYNYFQDDNKQDNKQITNKQQTDNKQVTTTNNDNNDNNENNIEDLPKWLLIHDWVAFKEMRQEIKKPMSQLAESRMIKKLDRLRNNGYDPSKLLDRSIINKWQDVFEDSSCKVKGEFSGMFG